MPPIQTIHGEGGDAATGRGDPYPPSLRCWEQEAADCRQRRINRLHRESKLPADKTWETFKHDWVSIALRQQLDQLGHFISAAYTAKRDPALHCQSRKLDTSTSCS